LGEFFDAVVADAAGRGLPWLALVPNRRLNVLPFAEVDAIGQNRGLKGLMTLTEMVGDVRALTPARPPRPELEFERVETAQDVEEVLAVNIEAYGMPQEIAASAIEERLFFADPAKEIGFVGKVDGRAVSTATAVELDGWLYVALVATRPGEQRKGYADAVMRKALEVAAEELNITRTALDASEMGAPVYAGMGYAPTGAQWRVLMAE
jgi:GNAT superfamily N-acetyltransferase